MFEDHKITYLRQHVRVRRVQRLSMLREAVAHMLAISARTIPHAAMVSEFDVTNLIEYTRDKGKAGADAETSSAEAIFKRAIHKNYSAFFLKAFSHALHHTPCMNAFLDYTPLRNGGTLYHAEDINLGFTVHTKYGVIRPVMRNAHQKTLETVAAEMRDLTRRARRTDPEEVYTGAAKLYIWPALKQLDVRALLPGWLVLRSRLFRQQPDPAYTAIPQEQKLRAEEILGATCTLANIGMMVSGHQTLMAITPPEVMMFGLGNLHHAARVIDGQVVPRWVIAVSAAMDHRAFDAGEAFPFGDHLRKYTDNPALIYEWKPGDEV